MSEIFGGGKLFRMTSILIFSEMAEPRSDWKVKPEVVNGNALLANVKLYCLCLTNPEKKLSDWSSQHSEVEG